MNFSVLIVLVGIALGFFVAAYIFRDERRGGYMMLSGFMIIMLVGILTVATGIKYPTGYTIDDTGAQSVLTTTYTDVSTIENTIVSMPFILAGLWGIIVVTNALYKTRNDKEEEDEG
jgi:hypothetical protein